MHIRYSICPTVAMNTGNLSLFLLLIMVPEMSEVRTAKLRVEMVNLLEFSVVKTAHCSTHAVGSPSLAYSKAMVIFAYTPN